MRDRTAGARLFGHTCSRELTWLFLLVCSGCAPDSPIGVDAISASPDVELDSKFSEPSGDALDAGGMLDTPVFPDASGAPLCPPTGCRFKQVVGGSNYTCALTIDGDVFCWGDNYNGAADPVGSLLYFLTNGRKTLALPTLVVGLPPKGIQSIAAGFEGTCALDATGKVWCWGIPASPGGPIDVAAMDKNVGPIAYPGMQAQFVAVGYDFACVIVAPGSVECWGDSLFDFGLDPPNSHPANATTLGDKVQSISAYMSALCVLDSAGQVTGMGWNPSIGLPSVKTIQFPFGTGNRSIALGGKHGCLIDAAGAVKCWGDNSLGQLGNGTNVGSKALVQVKGLEGGAKAVIAGEAHTCAIDEQGVVKCWGGNEVGSLGDGTTVGKNQPVAVNGLSGAAVSLGAGKGHTCAIQADGRLFCWGDNGRRQLGVGPDTTKPQTVAGFASGAKVVAAGGSHACAVAADGSVQCWGRNDLGQLGDGTLQVRATPVKVVGLESHPQSLVARRDHTCALTQAGKVYCWGDNTTDPTTAIPLPVEVTGITTAVQGISVGGDFTCALDVGGGVWCWGHNFSGQLGDGSTLDSAVPVQVKGLAGKAEVIIAAGSFACALTGTLWCWGSPIPGEMVQQPIKNAVPIQFSSETGITALAASDEDICAVNKTGDLSCSVVYYQPKLGTQAVAGGAYHFCTIDNGGAVACFGDNRYGQLGDGKDTVNLSEGSVTVAGLGQGVKMLAAGDWHTCAIDAAGAVKCWGYNAYGQMGDGSAIFPKATEVVIDGK